ncbi:MAG TPA: DUF881 domain-containing protein [Rugosimonospora sp.]|jgi:uncharacterized protein YlxW (UPF0749 family)
MTEDQERRNVDGPEPVDPQPGGSESVVPGSPGFVPSEAGVSGSAASDPVVPEPRAPFADGEIAASPAGGAASAAAGETPEEPIPPEAVPAPASTAAQAAMSRPSAGRGAAAGAPRRRRLSAAGTVIGLLLGLLGFALVVQLRSNAGDEQLSTERPEDLVRILSDLDARKDRLSQEISQEQDLKQQLQAGSQSRQAALAEASQRADALGILAGTLPATGPGLRVVFRAESKPIHASDVLDAVEELRGAGAEAMQIAGGGGATVRIIASTSFVDGTGNTLVVDDQTLNGPYTITVIGDPQTMQIALNIPSGVVDTVHSNGGTVSVVTPGTVQVTALHESTPPQYAKPAS